MLSQRCVTAFHTVSLSHHLSKFSSRSYDGLWLFAWPDDTRDLTNRFCFICQILFFSLKINRRTACSLTFCSRVHMVVACDSWALLLPQHKMLTLLWMKPSTLIKAGLPICYGLSVSYSSNCCECAAMWFVHPFLLQMVKPKPHVCLCSCLRGCLRVHKKLLLRLHHFSLTPLSWFAFKECILSTDVYLLFPFQTRGNKSHGCAWSLSI